MLHDILSWLPRCRNKDDKVTGACFLDGQVLIQKKNEKLSVQLEQWKSLSTYFHIIEVKRYMFRLYHFSKVVLKEL